MLLPGELVCRARRNISPQPCHQVIKAKLTTATSPNSHQKENVVVKLNMRKSLLQTLWPVRTVPRGSCPCLLPQCCCISIPGCHLVRASPCTGVLPWGWGWCRVCAMAAQPRCPLETPVPLCQVLLVLLGHWLGCKWAEIFFQLRWTHWSSEVWM